MNDDLKQYQVKATDWRGALELNKSRTRNVVILFVLIYLVVGFIIDLYIYAQNQPLEDTAKSIATFKVFPLGTLGMLGVAGLSLLVAFILHEKVTLLGTEYHEVTSDSTVLEERQLYNVVEELKIAAAMRFMPKIYIIEADYMNAFASGLSEKSAMIAITRPLLQKLDREELQAVMAHELSHIRHDDIRLTVMVLVLSNIMLIVMDILFRGILYGRSKKDNGIIFIILIARFLLPILTLLLMLYLSRTREFMADTGSVELTRSNEPLARALIKIHENTKEEYEATERAYANTPHEEVRRATYFYDPNYAGIKSFASINTLFSTHPPLAERLKALGIEKKNIDKIIP